MLNRVEHEKYFITLGPGQSTTLHGLNEPRPEKTDFLHMRKQI